MMGEGKKHYHRGRRNSKRVRRPEEPVIDPVEWEEDDEGGNPAKSSPARDRKGSRDARGKSGAKDSRKPGKNKKSQNKKSQNRKSKNKKSNMVSNIILVAAIAVFLVSGFQLFQILKGYYDGRSEYDKIRELAVTTDKKEKTEDGEEQFRVDFDELLKVNPDTIGWIRFSPEPSMINYPVVQGQDNEKYLKTTFSANENTLGAIFVNADNSADFSDRNTIIYGHRMKDGSMFRHLQDYEDKSFWEQNPNFYIYTPDGREITYKVFAAGQVKDVSDVYQTSFESDEAYQGFLDLAKQISRYDTGVELSTGDTIITLSTCTSASDDNRFVVLGVKEKEVNLNE